VAGDIDGVLPDAAFSRTSFLALEIGALLFVATRTF
jgi:hypothetical protein